MAGSENPIVDPLDTRCNFQVACVVAGNVASCVRALTMADKIPQGRNRNTSHEFKFHSLKA